MSEEHIIEVIKKIVAKGNNAEVKRRKDGSLVVYEVKKTISYPSLSEPLKETIPTNQTP